MKKDAKTGIPLYSERELARLGSDELSDYYYRILNTRGRSTPLQDVMERVTELLIYGTKAALEDAQPTKRSGWIYVIHAEGGFSKIGKATKLPRRVSEIMTNLPFEARLHHTLQTNSMTWAERALHQKFASKRARGEWFRLNDRDLDWLVSLDRLDEGDRV